MIEQSVRESAQDFAKEWSVAAEFSPLLKLDFTWPSLGLVDLLLLPLRGRSNLDQPAFRLLRGASAYLGMLAYECWSSFSEDVSLIVGERGVRLEAHDGPLLGGGDSFSVNIESALAKVLRELPSPMPVYSNQARQLSSEVPVVPLFAIGLFTGLCPYGSGPWSAATIDQFSEALPFTARILAAQCADFYTRVFPNETLGQVAELYLDGVLFPPPLTVEALPGIQAVERIAAFLEEYGIDAEKALPLFKNLALSPDEALSVSGLVFFAALSAQELPAVVIAAAQRKGMLMGMLRESMHAVRAHYRLGPDWLWEGRTDDAVLKLYQREQLLGMHPWVRLRAVSLKKPGVLDFVRECAKLDFAAAKHVLEKLVEETPGDIDLRLQRIFFDVIDGDVERAAAACRALITEPAAENDPRVLEFWGMSLLSQGNLEESLRHLERGYGSVGKAELEPDEALAGVVANDFALALIQAGRLEEALDVLKNAVKWDRCPLSALVNRYAVLATLGRIEEAADVQLKLLQLAPLDERVFHNTLSALKTSS